MPVERQPIPSKPSHAEGHDLRLAGLLAFAACGAIVMPLAAASGGYFPVSWNWGTIGFAWVIWTGLVTLRSVRLTKTTVAFVGGLLLTALLFGGSAFWATDRGAAVEAGELALLYAAGALAWAVLANRRTTPILVTSLSLAMTLVVCYSLATRLFPTRLPTALDPFSTYRLEAPIGYWNALGIFSASGLLLCLGSAMRSTALLIRVTSAATLPIFAATLYFTFSRGAMLALGVGLLVAIAIDPRRLQAVSFGGVLAAPIAIGIYYCSAPGALNHNGSSLVAASSAGRHLAWIIAGCVLASGSCCAALTALERRWNPSRRLENLYAKGVMLSSVLCALAALALVGSPTKALDRVWVDFQAPQPPTTADLNARLFSASSDERIDLWRGALEEFETHPVLGGGAGSFNAYWLEHRNIPIYVRDAHNLYLQSAAETGIIGLVVVAATLLLPLTRLPSARKRPLCPFIAATYIAYLIHVSVDWDWQVPAVTLPALLAAIALCENGSECGLVVSRRRWLSLTAPVVLLTAGAVGLMGNRAASAALSELESGHPAGAADAAKQAARWEPWSAEPWKIIAQAEEAQRHQSAAAAAVLTATSKDPSDWQTWQIMTTIYRTGPEYQRAAQMMRRLAPPVRPP